METSFILLGSVLASVVMGADDISEDVRQFVLRHIDSIELLSVLLLLQAHPKREWTTQSLENTIRSSPIAIGKRLNDLYSRGILLKSYPNEDRHIYTPKTEEIGRIIAELAICNKLYPYRVIDLIYERPTEALRSFAEAFRIGRKGRELEKLLKKNKKIQTDEKSGDQNSKKQK